MFKILYLEDDINLSNTIIEFLEDNDFNVVASYSIKDSLQKLYENNYDLLIFDVNLPDGNGFELLKTLRDSNINTPTIFTTTLDDINSLDIGYSVGADDYLRKPFLLKELHHRINSILKRKFNSSLNNIKISSNISFEISSNQLIVDNTNINLNQKELILLKLFLEFKNEIIPLELFYERLWNSQELHSEGSLRTYIKNLRKILGKEKIISIKKQGYKLVV